jgi:hypothetical protein
MTYLSEVAPHVIVAPLLGVIESSALRLVHLALNHGDKLLPSSVAVCDLVL